MLWVFRLVATTLMLVVLYAWYAVVGLDGFMLSRRLAIGVVLGPFVAWSLAFYGGTLGTLLGLPLSRTLDLALRWFGLFVLATILLLLLTAGAAFH